MSNSHEERTSHLAVPPALATLDRYHRDALAKLFGVSPPHSPMNPSLKFLFLCFTNRCGSNYLARLIASSGVLNVPEEVFNASTVQEHAQRRALRSLHDYINFLDHHLARSGWLTAKLGIEQMVMLTEAGILDEISSRTKFLHIERQNTVEQALSRVIATQNNLWTSQHVATIPDEKLVYSRADVDAQRASIAFENTAFRRFFAYNGLLPRVVGYEDLRESPDEHLSQIGSWLGFERFVADPTAIGIHRQESDIKRAWLQRYQRGD